MKEKRILSVISLIILICLLLSCFYVFFSLNHTHTCDEEYCSACEFLTEWKRSDSLAFSFAFIFTVLFLIVTLSMLTRVFFTPVFSLIKLKVKLSD